MHQTVAGVWPTLHSLMLQRKRHLRDSSAEIAHCNCYMNTKPTDQTLWPRRLQLMTVTSPLLGLQASGRRSLKWLLKRGDTWVKQFYGLRAGASTFTSLKKEICSTKCLKLTSPLTSSVLLSSCVQKQYHSFSQATCKPVVREHSAVTRGGLNRQKWFASLSSPPSFPSIFWTASFRKQFLIIALTIELLRPHTAHCPAS